MQFTSILWISTPLLHPSPSLLLFPASSISLPILSIISGSHFPLFQILSFLSFLILSPHFPSSLILYIHSFIHAIRLPPNAIAVPFSDSSMYHSVKTLKLLIPPHNPIPYWSYYPLGYCCCSQQWVRGSGGWKSPEWLCLKPTYFGEWYWSSPCPNCYPQCCYL